MSNRAPRGREVSGEGCPLGIKWLNILAFIGMATALADAAGAAGAEPGAGDGSLIKLEGDFLSMAELRLGGTQRLAQLAIFEADRSLPRRRRWVELLDKRDGRLTKSPNVALPDDVAAFDVCRLSTNEAAPDTLLLLRKDGVYALGNPKPIAKTTTLFAHARDDALPRVRICFDLFQGEPPALVVPELSGVKVFRPAQIGEKKGEHRGEYKEHASLPVAAEVGFQGQVLRGDDPARIQRIAMRLQFPDVSAPDFNGDGLIDLCFTAEESLVCRMQSTSGFVEAGLVRHDFAARTEKERLDSSLRVNSRLVDLSGDGRPDFVLSKSTWNVSAMGGSLHVYLQGAKGDFPKGPTQVMERQGYFAYQEYLDFDGDGLKDVLAPVASLGWTDLARIYLSRSADIDFVWFKNLGGKLDPEARSIHRVRFPVEFKNIAAILGALPIWDARLIPRDAAGAKERQILFFPEKKSLELRVAKGDGVGPVIWQRDVRLGSETIAIDLDGNGLQELVSAFPRDEERSGTLLFVDSPRG